MLSHTEEIKSKLDVVDVLQEYIKLIPAGKNFKALCPFHQEKTPSFMVSPERQSWHCFGCSEGGDIFSFVMKIEGIEFIEALKLLAKKAGVQLKPQDPKIVNRKNRLLDINELAKKFYAYLLKKSPAAESCRAYLRERKVSEQSVSDFELGYAPNFWDKTMSFLASKGYKQDEILASGLLVKKDGSSRCYDRFRNRLMFPINNLHGQTVGFSARALDKIDSAKYINSPQTDIYNKSEILYGLDKAKNSIRQKNSVILVEGQMDLISAHSAGDKNSVATSGTALTETQIRILKRYSDNLLLAFDADLAGQNAVKKGIDLAIELGMDIKMIRLPLKSDPDECIKNNLEDWVGAIKNAEPILEYYLRQAIENFSSETLSGRKEIYNMCFPAIWKVPNLVERNYYIKKLAAVADVPEESIRDDIKKINKNKNYKRQEAEIKSGKAGVKKERNLQIAEEMAAILLKFPSIFLAADFDLKILADEKIIGFCGRLSDFYKDEQQNFSVDEFVNILKQEDEALFNLSQSFLLLAERDFLDFNLKQAEKQAEKNLRELKKSYILKQKVKIEKEIKKAEENDAEDMIGELLARAKKLDERLLKLEL
ncbi:DNA primase [Candidatus Parcubacteria bacterium]|nr:DNA primase [Candidatus Parcubacteria bacterium]